MAEGLDKFPFDLIVRDLREGYCIPFLGAGASAFPRNVNAKPPSAPALARKLAEESLYPQYQVAFETPAPKDASAQERILRAKLDCENLMVVSSWYEHGGSDRPHLHRVLRSHLADERNPLPPNMLHKLLARVAQKTPMAIITTNYDDLIEEALKDEVEFDLFVVAIDRRATSRGRRGAILFRPAGHHKLEPVTAQQELLGLEPNPGEVRLKRTVLFKIHGHIARTQSEDDTFVITEEDYVSFLGRMGPGNSLIPADLVILMKSRTLLFLGYSLRDWNFRVLLERLNTIRPQVIRSYAIAYGIGSAESKLWDKRNVHVWDADLNDFVPKLDAAYGPT
jgi:hypothetical protein